MRTSYLFALLILLVTSTGFSQKKDRHFWRESSTALRLNLTSLTDPIETNFSAGAEHLLNNQWAAGLDIGYIFNSTYYEKTNSVSGIIIRPAIRYYFNVYARHYIEAELQYKSSRSKITDWLQKDLVNGVPTYQRYQDFTMAKNVYGINLKMGGRGSLSRNERLWIEYYFGMGIRTRRENVLHEPNSRYGIVNRFRIVDNTGSAAALFSIPLGVRLLLKI
jgi:Protein of unknown function (DUF3575)